jgi:hypothetical protein
MLPRVSDAVVVTMRPFKIPYPKLSSISHVELLH